MDDGRRRRWVVLLAAGFEGGFILLAWALGWLLGHPPLAHFSWDARAALWGIAAAVPMVLGALALMRWPVGPLARIKRFSEEVIGPLFAVCTPLDLAGIALVAGLGEEMFFRGVLQPAFAAPLGPGPAILIAGVVFGLLHPITATYVVLAAGAGVYLGWVFHATGNLLAVVVAHALYDFVILLYLARRSPSPPSA